MEKVEKVLSEMRSLFHEIMAITEIGNQRVYRHAEKGAALAAAAIREPECNCDAGERPWRDCELHDEE